MWIRFHLVTNSHEQISSALSAHKDMCASFGHALPRLVFTDCPYRNENFFNSMFPNLQDTSHATSNNSANANEIKVENNNINSTLPSVQLSIDDCVTSMNYNEISALWSVTKDEMGNK